METNLLKALKTLIENPVTDLSVVRRSSNRINNVGEALEEYVKDIFCNSFNQKNKEVDVFPSYFSYLGNQNNPPDMILKGGDAIEVKKIGNQVSDIALNSSYPKDKLRADSALITQACRDCEKGGWTEKDILYCIGAVKEEHLQSIWFVYGDCYAAHNDVYERVRTAISKGVQEIDGVSFSETNELGRINKVDPLGITYLRVRGMWGIKNPSKLFGYLVPQNSEFSVNALLLKSKYDSFPSKDKKALESSNIKGFDITDVKIQSPNNPAQLLDAKLISYRNPA